MKSKTIWKYPLKVTDSQTIFIPSGYEILTIQIQNNVPYLWALVDPEEKEEAVNIEIFGTGHAIYFDGGFSREYISTFQFQMNGEYLVFHAFKLNITK